MFSTDIKDLLPGTQKKILLLESRLEQRGLYFRRTCVYRSKVAQEALYLRGRGTYDEIIEAYKEEGMTPPLDRDEPGWWKKKVTWTLNSMHTKRRAVDYCQRGRNPYDLKIDVNRNEVPDWEEFAIIARWCGLNAGFFWQPPKRDAPHVEDNEIYGKEVITNSLVCVNKKRNRNL
jgi:hypothetical protein